MGSLSPFLGILSFLRKLALTNNSFIQEIPLELGRLTRIQYLSLDNNSIGGEIPVNISSGWRYNLISFGVSYNKLVGKIPEEFGFLLKLQRLYVSENNLTGAIPPSLGNLSASLLYFWAASNNLEVIIPNALGQLSNLEFFGLDDNRLSGIVPPSLLNLSFLKTYSLSINQIQGNLSSDLGITLPNVNFFNIFANKFTGSIPSSISNMSNLVYLDIAINGFVGKVPDFGKLKKLYSLSFSGNHLGSGEANDLSFISSLTNASNLELLALNNNDFRGVLPKSFANLSTQLVRLHLEYNQLLGPIPTGITNLVNLQELSESNNHLTGSLPDIGKLHKLIEVELSQNKFSGSIPSSVGNLSTLTKLSQYDNSFQGTIPSSLGNCTNLLSLSLAQNNLSGIIPAQIFFLSSLAISLNLSHNQLTGPLPIDVENLKNLQALDFSENVLYGNIPTSLGGCVKLEILSMKGNFFQVTIPSTLHSLKGIQFLDLSHNNLSGKIPGYFAGLDLQYLNQSFNDFEGALPDGGLFNNASAVFVNGNPLLCGGIPEMQLPKCIMEQSKKHGSTFTLKLIISLVFGVLGLGLALCFSYIFWLKSTNKEPHLSSAGNSLIEVSYQSHFRATNGFSSDNFIGMGSFGSVYKATHDPNGTTIAVKVFNLMHPEASKSFIAECEALRRTRHRNLVKVLKACSGIDHQRNDFKALVYEFMPNGSLEEWLHPILRNDLEHVESKNLKLLQRLNIAIDVASALDYLHNQGQAPIVHCDIKPSNVLLDDELVGHVGDFGISRFLLTEHQEFSIRQ